MNEPDNPTIFTAEKYENYFSYLAQENQSVKAPATLSLKERNKLHQQFCVMRDLYIFDGHQLFTKSFKGTKLVASHDNAFDIIIRAHEESDLCDSRHRKITETHRCVKNIAYGISQKDIKWLLPRCLSCKEKFSKDRKPPTHSIDTNTTFDSLQIDYIYMGSTTSDGYKWVLMLRDHVSNYVVLHALKEKNPKRIAKHLSDFFTFLTPPAVIQYEDDMAIDGAIALLLSNDGLSIKRGCKRDFEVARFAAFMCHVVRTNINEWVAIKGRRSWKKSIQCAQRSINA